MEEEERERAMEESPIGQGGIERARKRERERESERERERGETDH